MITEQQYREAQTIVDAKQEGCIDEGQFIDKIYELRELSSNDFQLYLIKNKL